MQYARRNLALYVTNRSQSFVVAPAILLMVAVIMIIIGLIIGIRTGLPAALSQLHSRWRSPLLRDEQQGEGPGHVYWWFPPSALKSHRLLQQTEAKVKQQAGRCQGLRWEDLVLPQQNWPGWGLVSLEGEESLGVRHSVRERTYK